MVSEAFNIAELGFNPELSSYTPNGGYYSSYIMMYFYSIICLLLTIIYWYNGYFRPLLSCNLPSITKKKYNNAGWHFFFLFITWLISAIRHNVNDIDYIMSIIWSVCYHFSILFYLLSIGPPPDFLKITNIEWIIFIIFSLFLTVSSFIVDFLLNQTIFCFLLWFSSNLYLFIVSLIDLHFNGCSKTPFYFHSSVLFTIFASIICFTSFHFFKGFESTSIINNYVLIIGCFISSTLFYFGALMLESKEKNKKHNKNRYDGRGHQSMISFDQEYNDDTDNQYEEVALISIHPNYID